jgi:hypothetical protein
MSYRCLANTSRTAALGHIEGTVHCTNHHTSHQVDLRHLEQDYVQHEHRAMYLDQSFLCVVMESSVLSPLMDSSSSNSDDDLTPIRSSTVSLMESVMAMTELETTSKSSKFRPGCDLSTG